MKIVEISPETAREILNSINEGGDRYQPLGLFYLQGGTSSSVSTTATGTPGPRSSWTKRAAFGG